MGDDEVGDRETPQEDHGVVDEEEAHGWQHVRDDGIVPAPGPVVLLSPIFLCSVEVYLKYPDTHV